MKNIILGNLYRPPQNDSIPNHDMFILGDTNINYLDTHNPATKQLKSLTSSHGLDQIIKQPTRYSMTKNSLIVQIFTNCDDTKTSGVKNWNISDHELVHVTRKKESPPVKKSSFIGRLYKNYDKIYFQQMISNHDWTDFTSADSPDLAWSIMKETIEGVIDRMCPLKLIKIKKVKKDWVSQELLEQITLKDHLLAKAKRTNKPEDWARARKIRNDTNLWAKKAKSEYIKKQLDNNLNDHKMFWRSIKNIIPNQKQQSQHISLIDEISNLTVPDELTANYINEHFATIGPKLAQNLNAH